MRGSDVMPENLFTAGKLDDHVPADHPLRFVGIPMEREIGNRSVFSRNRGRLLEHEAVKALFTGVMTLAGKRNLRSQERCPADGAPIQARASPKSFRPKDEPDDTQADGGRLRLGQDGGADSAGGVSRHQTRRPALQAHPGRQQSGENRPNAVCGAARSAAMRRRRGWGAPETPRADGDFMPTNRIRPRPEGKGWPGWKLGTNFNSLPTMNGASKKWALKSP